LGTPGTFEFAGIAFDARSGLLRRDDASSRLEPRAADVLALLCAERGEVVSRDRLLDQCWGDGSGSDEALTQAVAQIRRALEAIGAPRDLLTTYPKRGYRLSAFTDNLRARPRRARIPLWLPLALVLAGCILILVIAPGWPRHAIRHALGLGPAHNGAAPGAGSGGRQ
jgi:DNA-binding winged helix-turn-helix (wHTH) protein